MPPPCVFTKARGDPVASRHASLFDLDAVNRVEVFGTDIDDPGEDYCEFRVIDCKEKVMAVRREMGY